MDAKFREKTRETYVNMVWEKARSDPILEDGGWVMTTFSSQQVEDPVLEDEYLTSKSRLKVYGSKNWV